jgi:hypothetical protein
MVDALAIQTHIKIILFPVKEKFIKLNLRSDLIVTGMSYTQSASDNKRVP